MGGKRKIKKGSFRDLMKGMNRLYHLLQRFRNHFAIAFSIILLVEILALATQYLFKDVIDVIVKVNSDTGIMNLVWLILVIALINFIISVLEYYNNFLTTKTEIKIMHFLEIKVFRKLLELSMFYHEKEKTGSKISKISRGIDNIGHFISNLTWNFSPTFFRILASAILLFVIDYRLGVGFFIIIPLFVWATFKMNKKAYPVRKGIWKGFERVYGRIGQSIYNIKTVQSFAQEDREKKQARFSVLRLMEKQFKYIKILFSFGFLRNNFITLGNIIVFSLGGYLAYYKQITPGELVLFITVSNMCYYSLYSISRVFDQLMEAKVGIDRIIEILDSKNAIEIKPEAKKVDIRGEIQFKNVTFSYDDKDKFAINNVNFKVKQGETVALVGHSGGGKTTIAKLLYRYFDPQKGQILIDNNDIRDIDLFNYRRQLGVVDQDIDIFDDTVYENIAYGDPSANMKMVKNAAKISNAHEFIDKLEKKYKTVVGERGIKLSGGQKQRIGIARAVLVDPKILVLDEATSSLDANSERIIQKAIDKIIKNRTTIIIAHRLSTIRNADRILVVEHGKIAEQGTHKSLLRKRGVYSRLVKLQIGGFIE